MYYEICMSLNSVLFCLYNYVLCELPNVFLLSCTRICAFSTKFQVKLIAFSFLIGLLPCDHFLFPETILGNCNLSDLCEAQFLQNITNMPIRIIRVCSLHLKGKSITWHHLNVRAEESMWHQKGELGFDKGWAQTDESNIFHIVCADSNGRIVS